MKHSTQFCLALASLLALSSCDKAAEFTLHESERSYRLVDSSAERFRYQSREKAAPSPFPNTPPAGPSLSYSVPEGWSEKPASAMRDASLAFGPNDEGECYVARLPGMGGGLAANVNRWRGQMGAKPLSEAEVAALPKQKLFGQDATLVEVEGDFAPGMGSQSVKDEYRLLGLVLTSDNGAVFVKMTGPKELVAENRSQFDSFVSSLSLSAKN